MRPWLVVNSERSEAVTVTRRGTLQRWRLGTQAELIRELHIPRTEIYAIAVLPHGEELLLCADRAAVEIRDWDTLQTFGTLAAPEVDIAQSAAFSPDGRWLALANDEEAVLVVDLRTGRTVAELDGGEYTSAVCFSPSSELLAAGCCFQGGAFVLVSVLKDTGRFELLYDSSRVEKATPSDHFVDTIVDVAFSTDSRSLALFEASGIQSEYREGWQGDLALYSMRDGGMRWRASLDAAATGDPRPQPIIGPVFLGKTVLLGAGIVGRVSWPGSVLLYDAATGRRVGRTLVGSDAPAVDAVADSSGTTLWVLLDNGRLVSVPTRLSS